MISDELQNSVAALPCSSRHLAINYVHIDDAILREMSDTSAVWIAECIYSVSQKTPPPRDFLTFFKLLGIFSPNFTFLLFVLLFVPIYDGKQFYARQHYMLYSAYIGCHANFVCLSVRLSVPHMRVLYQNR